MFISRSLAVASVQRTCVDSARGQYGTALAIQFVENERATTKKVAVFFSLD